MILYIEELCEVDYINEDDEEEEIEKRQFAKRSYYYESQKDNLYDAILDFEQNFDSDNLYHNEDDFDGCCLDSVVTLIEEVVDEVIDLS